MEDAVTRDLETPLASPPVPSRPERLALRILQVGAVVVVLAAATWKGFDLDRFFVPKELALHAAAFLAGFLSLGAFARTRFTRTDHLLLAVVLLGIVSAATAVNPWLGARAVAIAASSIAIFWTARALAGAGLARPLLAALALAVVLGTGTALLQTYGVRTDFFTTIRAPGGTLGNRNFIAHLAAFGAPVVLLAALRARNLVTCLAWTVAAALVIASLILTRSRAGWLAFAAVAVVFAFTLFASPPLRRHGRTWLRLAGMLALAGAGVGAALTLPNTLRWRSDNPYLESVKGVANYQDGSGRGRLIQYERSLRMAAHEPLLGVGPGNWGVVYPEYAAPRDPSLDRSAAGMTSNPWPSSDWIAFISERGLPAAILLGLALLGIALGAFRRLRAASDPEEGLVAGTLLATGIAATVAGVFDAVLLLALPAFLVWAVLGALSGVPPVSDVPATAGPPEAAVPGTAGRPRRSAHGLALALVALLALGGALRSASQLAAMGLYSADNNTLLRVAAVIDPGNYVVRLKLAQRGGREQRCRHAEAAAALYPKAAAARRLARGC